MAFGPGGPTRSPPGAPDVERGAPRRRCVGEGPDGGGGGLRLAFRPLPTADPRESEPGGRVSAHRPDVPGRSHRGTRLERAFGPPRHFHRRGGHDPPRGVRTGRPPGGAVGGAQRGGLHGVRGRVGRTPAGVGRGPRFCKRRGCARGVGGPGTGPSAAALHRAGAPHGPVGRAGGRLVASLGGAGALAARSGVGPVRRRAKPIAPGVPPAAQSSIIQPLHNRKAAP